MELSFEQFYNFVGENKEDGLSVESDVRDVFNTYDTDGDKVISQQELGEWMLQHGIRLKSHQVVSVIKALKGIDCKQICKQNE